MVLKGNFLENKGLFKLKSIQLPEVISGSGALVLNPIIDGLSKADFVTFNEQEIKFEIDENKIHEIDTIIGTFSFKIELRDVDGLS